MQIDRNTGLVLEGGGMRGVFTSGVLDAFMKYKLYFHYIVAVSAGACNGLSYASRQPRRARISNIDMLAKYDYIGLRHLVTQGCIFDPDLLYHRFPYELIPFDYEEYFRNCRNGDIFEMVVTNCQTGLQSISQNRQVIRIVLMHWHVHLQVFLMLVRLLRWMVRNYWMVVLSTLFLYCVL